MVKSCLIFSVLVIFVFGVKASNRTHEYVPGELIVKLHEGSDKSIFSNMAQDGVELKRAIKLSQGELILIRFDESKSIEHVQEFLQKNENIAYAGPNYIVRAIGLDDDHASLGGTAAPNDPKFSKLWGLSNTGSNEPRRTQPGIKGADIDALKAWQITKGDRNIKIAVIDTGIDYRHPDLKNQMSVNEKEFFGKPNVDDDQNGFVDDVYGFDFANDDGDPLDGQGHGTHCAGIIGAEHDNGLGVAGVMGEVSLLAVKFLTDSGEGTTLNAIRAIDYAISEDVDIMSNSWGGGKFSQALRDIIQQASDRGIIFVAAAGNSTSNNDVIPMYPANYAVDNIISVAAHTAQDDLAYFSSMGKKTVHIAAPGYRILSTVPGTGVGLKSGTSMATPHVSGALGLLLSQEGRISHHIMRDRLLNTTIPVSDLERKVTCGGRLNAYNLLADIRPSRQK